MNKTDKSSGRGCALSIAARKLAGDLVEDGILNQPIAREPRKNEGDIVFRFDNSGYYYRASSQWLAERPPDEPLWKPTIIDPGIWEKVAKAFRPRHNLKYNVEQFLLPEMKEYLESLTGDALIELVHEFLLDFDIINSPIRQIAGDTFYFNEDEIYTKDIGSRIFEYEGRMRFHIFKVTDYSSFNGNVWTKAVKRFEPGMTLKDCIKVFLETELEFNPPVADLPYIEKLVQHIEAPIYERIPENENEATFDRIRVFVGLPRYMFNSWDELKAAVRKNRAEIDRRVIQRIEEDRHFRKFKVPINFIKLSDVLLRRTFSLEYIFELKE